MAKEDDVSETAPLLSGRPVETEDEENLTGCGATAACNPHRALHRYIALFFICLLSFGESGPKLSLRQGLHILILTCIAATKSVC